MNSKPIKFSEHFNIPKDKLSELGVFDPILNLDTQVFVDPLLLKDSKIQKMRDASGGYKLYFANLMTLLKASIVVGDKCWRAAQKLVDFPEYKYTCIGYGSGTINGAGSGAVLNDKILQSAKEIIILAKDDPDIFLLLPLLEEGIGADIISDMTQNIIDDYICEYTVDVVKKLGITGTYKHYSRSNKIYHLPYNQYHKCPIKLIPVDILSNLPLAETFDTWLVDLSLENHILRKQVNELIGTAWLETTKSLKKETILALIKKDKNFFLSVLSALKNESFEHYDLDKDFEGLYRWIEDSKIISNINALGSKSLNNNMPLYDKVGIIINELKMLIETNELWRLFWTDLYNKHKHVKEFYSQMLFYMVGSAWVAAQGNKITIDRIFNKDSQQLEIIFTIPGQQRVKVQLKHSDNYAGLKKCYEDQVSQCARKKINCYYVVFDFMETKAKQFERILEIEDPVCKIIEIDVVFRGAVDLEINNDFTMPDFGDLTTQYFDIDVDQYLNEKRKGGENSHKANKNLKQVVEQICRKKLNKNRYPSALNLCDAVSKIVEVEYGELLNSFAPYKQGSKNGKDWRHPTFYRWCKDAYKSATVRNSLLEEA